MLPSEAMGKFYLPTHHDGLHMAPVAVPVGEYGEQFSLDVLRTVTILKRAATQMVKAEAAQVKQENPELISKVVLDRERVNDPILEEYNSPLVALHDGLDSIADAIMHSMGKKNGGPDDPLVALRAVVAQRIPEELSLRLAFGVIAPARANNKVLADLVTWTDDVPAVSAERKSSMRDQKMQMHNTFRDGRIGEDLTDMGCPVGHAVKSPDGASETSGVQALSETFLQVMEDLAHWRERGIDDDIPSPVLPADAAPRNFSTIPPDITAPKLLAEVDSFQNANDELLEKATAHRQAIARQLTEAGQAADPESSPELAHAIAQEQIAMQERTLISAAKGWQITEAFYQQKREQYREWHENQASIAAADSETADAAQKLTEWMVKDEADRRTLAENQRATVESKLDAFRAAR
jgi:hypothetical protein